LSKRTRLITHSLTLLGLVVLAGCGGGEKHGLVAYGVVRDEVPTRIIVVQDDGKKARRVTGAKRGASPVLPTWSPDGQKIAFVRFRAQGGPTSLRTSVVNEDGTGERELGQGTLPGWANGARSLVVERPRAAPQLSTISVLPVDGKTAPRDLVVGSSPAVSHDGKRVAFVRYAYKRKQNGECCVTTKTELYTIGVDGKGLRRLARTGREGQFTQPSWLPDDSKIAVLERRGGLGGPLWTISLAGAKQKIVNRVGETYDWSPKGDLVAYTSGGLLYIVRPDGSEVANYGQSNAIDIEWSPDGKKVAFSMQEALENMQFVGLYLVDMENNERRRFALADGYAAYLDWQPESD
jgi:Tol biopolymer transport system component